jgi:hypothetical protein
VLRVHTTAQHRKKQDVTAQERPTIDCGLPGLPPFDLTMHQRSKQNRQVVTGLPVRREATLLLFCSDVAAGELHRFIVRDADSKQPSAFVSIWSWIFIRCLTYGSRGEEKNV